MTQEHRTRVISIFFSLLFFCAYANGQNLTDQELTYLNKQIRFYNETVHRMVIVFQIFEVYNRQVTQHIDLPMHRGLIKTSSHLAENIFADTSLVISADSPIEIYDDLVSAPIDLPISTSNVLSQVRKSIDFLSKDRRALNEIAENNDLEQFANIQQIYGELEDALKTYDQIRANGKTLESLLRSYYHGLVIDATKKQVYTAFLELHYDIKKIVRQLREENQSGVINGISKLEKELSSVRASINKLDDPIQQSELQDVLETLEGIVLDFRNYSGVANIPSEFNPYGKSYYYHNYAILSKINQYGMGYVWKLEKFFQKYGWNVISFLEEPHYLKLIYPERLPLEVLKNNTITPESNIRTLLEEQLPILDNLIVAKEEIELEEVKKELPLNVVHTETIRVDTSHIVVSLRDHLRKDGDRVSVMINGEWIHERISLETEIREINLETRPNSSNIVVIRADNTGWQPPNTIAIRYKGKSAGQKIFIKKDLGLYDAIELKFIN